MEPEFDPFFESATFCYLKSGQNGSCIPDVRDQGAKDVCLSFALTAAVYADSVLIDTRGNPLVGSRQELIDCLHIYAPLENQKLGKVKVTSRGVPNTYRNGLNYIKDIGICFEQDYEFKGSPHVCKEPVLEKLSKGHKIERKIFINDYVQIDVSGDINLSTMKRYEHVIHQLEIQPVVGGFLLTSSFKDLDHSKTPIYMGASAYEKMEYQERKRNQTRAGEEAEKKIFLEKCAKEDVSKNRFVAPINKKSTTDKRRHGHIGKEVIEVVNEKVTKEAPPDVGYHAALVVGYGELNGVAYFICQNSYGLNWGHNGYFRIAMDAMSQFYYPVGSMYKNINKGTIDRTQERINELKAKKKEAELKAEAEWRAAYDSQMSKEHGQEKETE